MPESFRNIIVQQIEAGTDRLFWGPPIAAGAVMIGMLNMVGSVEDPDAAFSGLAYPFSLVGMSLLAGLLGILGRVLYLQMLERACAIVDEAEALPVQERGPLARKLEWAKAWAQLARMHAFMQLLLAVAILAIAGFKTMEAHADGKFRIQPPKVASANG